MIDFELQRIIGGKLQTTITFDWEVGWRRVKNESCWKRGNKGSCQYLKGIGPPKFQKSIVYYFFFIFL